MQNSRLKYRINTLAVTMALGLRLFNFGFLPASIDTRYTPEQHMISIARLSQQELLVMRGDLLTDKISRLKAQGPLQEAYYRLGLIEEQLGDYEGAKAAYKKVLEAEGFSDFTPLQEGNSYAKRPFATGFTENTNQRLRQVESFLQSEKANEIERQEEFVAAFTDNVETEVKDLIKSKLLSQVSQESRSSSPELGPSREGRGPSNFLEETISEIIKQTACEIERALVATERTLLEGQSEDFNMIMTERQFSRLFNKELTKSLNGMIADSKIKLEEDKVVISGMFTPLSRELHCDGRLVRSGKKVSLGELTISLGDTALPRNLTVKAQEVLNNALKRMAVDFRVFEVRNGYIYAEGKNSYTRPELASYQRAEIYHRRPLE